MAIIEGALTCGVFMVVGLLGDGIHKLGAIRDHAAVIGETVLPGVVGHGVVGGGVLGPGHGEYEEHQGRHGDGDVQDSEEADAYIQANFSFLSYRGSPDLSLACICF